MRAAKVGHVFWPHRERCNGGVASSKKISALDEIFEKWVEAQVGTEAREIVGVSEPMVIPVLISMSQHMKRICRRRTAELRPS